MIKILSDEKIAKAINDSPEPHGQHFGRQYVASDVREGHRAIAQAQNKDTIRQIIEWGNETCPLDLFGEGTQCFKHACDLCWQELQSEVTKE